MEYKTHKKPSTWGHNGPPPPNKPNWPFRKVSRPLQGGQHHVQKALGEEREIALISRILILPPFTFSLGSMRYWCGCQELADWKIGKFWWITIFKCLTFYKVGSLAYCKSDGSYARIRLTEAIGKGCSIISDVAAMFGIIILLSSAINTWETNAYQLMACRHDFVD